MRFGDPVKSTRDPMIPLVPCYSFVLPPADFYTNNKPIRNNKTNSTNAKSDRGVVSVGCKPSQENKKQNRKVNKPIKNIWFYIPDSTEFSPHARRQTGPPPVVLLLRASRAPPSDNL